MRRAQSEENKFAKFATRFDDKNVAIAAWEHKPRTRNLKNKEKKALEKKYLEENSNPPTILRVENLRIMK
jgi:hypothetical protein